MKVELEPIEATAGAEAYRVRAIEDDGAKAMMLGAVHRMSPSEWEFVLQPGDAPESERLTIKLQAATVDELRDVIRDRFGLLEITADRLQDESMRVMVVALLEPVTKLATDTNTVAGFTSALCTHLGLIAVHDINDAGREEFLTTVAERIRVETVEASARREARRTMQTALRSMFEGHFGPLDKADDEPTKH